MENLNGIKIAPQQQHLNSWWSVKDPLDIIKYQSSNNKHDTKLQQSESFDIIPSSDIEVVSNSVKFLEPK